MDQSWDQFCILYEYTYANDMMKQLKSSTAYAYAVMIVSSECIDTAITTLYVSHIYNKVEEHKDASKLQPPEQTMGISR